MPSLRDAVASTSNLEDRYAPVASSRPLPPPPTDYMGANIGASMEPGRNPMLRCPLPALWQASPDSLRQFYINGQVPQARTMLPPAPVSVGDSTTIENVQVAATGSSGSASAATGFAASSASVKTPVLPPGNKFVGSLLLAKSFQLLSMAVQSTCRIQLYGTAAAQAADLSRALDAPPAAGTPQNIICDLVLDTAPYQWGFQNRVGANADSPQTSTVYVTITNLNQTSDTKSVTIQFVPLES